MRGRIADSFMRRKPKWAAKPGEHSGEVCKNERAADGSRQAVDFGWPASGRVTHLFGRMARGAEKHLKVLRSLKGGNPLLIKSCGAGFLKEFHLLFGSPIKRKSLNSEVWTQLNFCTGLISAPAGLSTAGSVFSTGFSKVSTSLAANHGRLEPLEPLEFLGQPDEMLY